MKRPEPESPEAERRSQRAADWLVRRDRGLTAAEQDEFLQWLAIDPRHGEWFALHRSVVGEFSALAQWRPEHSEEPNPDLLAPPRRGIHWLVPTLLAAAAAVALAAVWWRSTPAPASVAAIASSELKRRILEDGSSVEPNHGAVVTTEATIRYWPHIPIPISCRPPIPSFPIFFLACPSFFPKIFIFKNSAETFENAAENGAETFASDRGTSLHRMRAGRCAQKRRRAELWRCRCHP